MKERKHKEDAVTHHSPHTRYTRPSAPHSSPQHCSRSPPAGPAARAGLVLPRPHYHCRSHHAVRPCRKATRGGTYPRCCSDCGCTDARGTPPSASRPVPSPLLLIRLLRPRRAPRRRRSAPPSRATAARARSGASRCSRPPGTRASSRARGRRWRWWRWGRGARWGGGRPRRGGGGCRRTSQRIEIGRTKRSCGAARGWRVCFSRGSASACGAMERGRRASMRRWPSWTRIFQHFR
jgi:hypothetical protein